MKRKRREFAKRLAELARGNFSYPEIDIRFHHPPRGRSLRSSPLPLLIYVRARRTSDGSLANTIIRTTTRTAGATLRIRCTP